MKKVSSWHGAKTNQMPWENTEVAQGSLCHQHLQIHFLFLFSSFGVTSVGYQFSSLLLRLPLPSPKTSCLGRGTPAHVSLHAPWHAPPTPIRRKEIKDGKMQLVDFC